MKKTTSKGTNYSTAENIAFARAYAGNLAKAVKLNAGPKQVPGGYVGMKQDATAAAKAKRLQQLADASKTAGRAANVESKLKKAAAAKNLGLKKMNLDKKAKKK